MSAGTLELQGLTRRFGSQAAVDDVSLTLAPGELLALVGASGSGKTTTLRMVAGYELPDAGSIRLDGRDITRLPPQGRGFGMVFQHYALFPHMPVEQNVAFGLEARGVSKRERLEKARASLAAVGLAHAAGRQIQSLSGGEQQRVALARALVIEPHVLLLDEPLSNLDPTLRESMREELRATLVRLGVTALFVTHDQEDAFAVADRVAILQKGKLLQVGSPEELYDRPRSRDVAEFIGRSALMRAELDGDRATIRVAGIAQTVGATVPDDLRLTSGLAVLRPEALSLVAAPGDTAAWPGTVTSRRYAGSFVVYRITLADSQVVEVSTPVHDARAGDAVGVRIARAPVAIVPA